MKHHRSVLSWVRRSLVAGTIATFTATLWFAACTSPEGVEIGVDSALVGPDGPESAAAPTDSTVGSRDASTTDSGESSADSGDASPDASADSANTLPLSRRPPCGFDGGFVPDSGDGKQYLVDLGHTGALSKVVRRGDRVLSARGGDWILWDSDNGRQLARGRDGRDVPALALGGGFFVGHDSTGRTTVRKVSDGQVAFTSPVRLYIESTGTYVWGVDSAGNLVVYSASGVQWVSRPGYSSALVAYAAPGELRILAGAAGSDVVETIALPAGTSSVSPSFIGTSPAWFTDGEHFSTVGPGIRRVYTKAGLLPEIVTPPTLEGFGGSRGWYWTRSATKLRFYKLGGGSVLSKEFNLAISLKPSELRPDVIGMLDTADPSKVTIFDLTTDPVSRRDLASPLEADADSVLGVDSLDRWVVANGSGAMWSVLVGDPSHSGPLSCGTVRNMKSSETGTVLLATAVGTLLTYDVSGASAVFKGAHDVQLDDVALTRNGSIAALHEQTRQDTQTTRVVELPGMLVTKTWVDPSQKSEIALARDGARIARTFFQSGTMFSRFVTDLSGVTTFFQDQSTNTASFLRAGDAPPLLALSPDGTHSAISVGGSTRIYNGNVLRNAVLGYPIGWISNDRLIVSQYALIGSLLSYTGTTLVDASGAVVSTLAVPELGKIQPVSSTTFYSGRSGAVYDVNGNVVFDGNPLCVQWCSQATVSGSRYVYLRGDRIIVHSY